MAAGKKTTAIVKWDEELAKQAEAAAASEANTGGGRFVSIRGGVLSFNGAPVPGNAIAVVIADHIFENVLYEGDFDPDNITAPACFAFGRDEKDMKPHDDVENPKSDDGCKSCPLNVFGSADKGRGKACRNTRRLGLLNAGTIGANGKFKLIEDDEYWQKSEAAYLKLPVTSVKGFAAYVKQIAAALKRPPHGVVTKLSVQPDPKSQFKVVFEPMMKLPDSVMSAIMTKREQVQNEIAFPYQPADEAAKKPVKKSAKNKRY